METPAGHSARPGRGAERRREDPAPAARASRGSSRATVLGSLTIPGRPEQVSLARAFVARTLRVKQIKADADAATLLTSEIVTNAIQHTKSGVDGGTVTIVVIGVAHGVIVEIIDDGSAGAPIVKGDLYAAEGHGLFLVEQFAAEWGYLKDLAGTTVWFHLPTAGEPRQAAITPDGCAVDLYAQLPDFGEPAIVHDAIGAGASILELGCGTGRLAHPLAALGHPVVAVDESPEMLTHVRDAETVCARIEGLALGRRFDAVVLASHLLNVADESIRRQLLIACRDHVADDGCVIVQHHPPEWFAEAAETEHTSEGMTFRLRDVSRPAPNLVKATVEYVIGDQVWMQTFTAMRLDESELAAALAAAGLRLDRYLTENHAWFRAVPVAAGAGAAGSPGWARSRESRAFRTSDRIGADEDGETDEESRKVWAGLRGRPSGRAGHGSGAVGWLVRSSRPGSCHATQHGPYLHHARRQPRPATCAA